MKVYLAARFDRKDEMKALSLLLNELGIECTSRWLDEKTAPKGKKNYERFITNTAQIDADDVYAADTLIRFSDDLSTTKVPSRWCTSSRFEETGMAYAWGKKIIIVGGHQSLFDRFQNRVHVQGTAELLRYLRRRQ
jgi:predicted metal-dependent HD superfamily phosphohydrolase